MLKERETYNRVEQIEIIINGLNLVEIIQQYIPKQHLKESATSFQNNASLAGFISKIPIRL
jgi:hypothetical protein